MPKIARRLFAAAVALTVGLSAGAAGAAEIRVLCAGAMRAVLQQLAPAFEKSSGDKLVIEYATAGKVEEDVAGDEAIDVAILTKPRAEKLVRDAKLVGGTVVALARAPIGLAVKKGAPDPDISSVEAFKRTLLEAKSVAYVDPASGGTSGIHIAQILHDLGIFEEIKAKIKPVTGQPGASTTILPCWKLCKPWTGTWGFAPNSAWPPPTPTSRYPWESLRSASAREEMVAASTPAASGMTPAAVSWRSSAFFFCFCWL